ncbi:MAG: TauD/TfdA family dioxygenase [Parvibaculum sp.]|nr:TauD/TfdA family dioxygenase [Parvibaculum sp.]
MFNEHGSTGYRWDSIFLSPVNGASQAVNEYMFQAAPQSPALVEVSLSRPGDTLIVDNWKCLHGRSAVPPEAVGRRVERVYMSEIYA